MSKGVKTGIVWYKINGEKDPFDTRWIPVVKRKKKESHGDFIGLCKI